MLPPLAPLDARSRWVLGVVLAVATLARVGWAVKYANAPVDNLADPVLYGLLADQIAHGRLRLPG